MRAMGIQPARAMRPIEVAKALGSGAVTFGWLIFFLHPIQVASLVVRPFSRPAFRRVNRWCARSIWGAWVLLVERIHGDRLVITGDRPPSRENAIVIANHQSMVDIMVLLCLAWRCQRLGHLKFFAKKAVKYVPGPGWGMQFLDCVFVDRDWTRDRARIESVFARFRLEKIPIFLVSFLEGTRITPAKHAAAVAHATERGLAAPRHTLIPRTKGFVAMFQGLHGHVDAVYDLTIGYPNGTPTLFAGFGGCIGDIALDVRRYDTADLPSPDDEAGLTAWVQARYAEKDERLAVFHATGAFPGESTAVPVQWAEWFESEDA